MPILYHCKSSHKNFRLGPILINMFFMAKTIFKSVNLQPVFPFPRPTPSSPPRYAYVRTAPDRVQWVKFGHKWVPFGHYCSGVSGDWLWTRALPSYYYLRRWHTDTYTHRHTDTQTETVGEVLPSPRPLKQVMWEKSTTTYAFITHRHTDTDTQAHRHTDTYT